MYNCLVMGSGRSGTSLVAGILAKSGYYMGDNLIPPRPANPKGFFETSVINLDINENLLFGAVPRGRSSLQRGQLWLDVLPLTVRLPKSKVINNKIKMMIGKVPFCYKDPRFCYTVPAWKPFLINTKFICVFRHPANTAISIMKECSDAKYLRNVKMNIPWALQVWTSAYKHVLKHCNTEDGLFTKKDWLFIHYDQALMSEGLDTISKFLDVTVDYSFPEKKFKRSTSIFNVPNDILKTYKQLCGLARY